MSNKVYVNKKLNESIAQNVANILFNDFNILEEDYNRNTKLIEDLNLTDYGFQQLLLTIEKKYDIELSDKDCETIQGLVEQIELGIINSTQATKRSRLK